MGTPTNVATASSWKVSSHGPQSPVRTPWLNSVTWRVSGSIDHPFDGVERRGYRIRADHEVQRLGADEPERHEAGCPLDETPVVVVNVEEHDRLGVQGERRGGPHLEQFVERAEAAGQDEERVGLFNHEVLPAGQVGGDDQ